MILLHCPRRTPLSRHRDEKPVTTSPLDSALTNRDARKSFRMRFYEKCRVSPASSIKDLESFSSSPVASNALCSLFSLFAPRVFHNSFPIRWFRTLSENSRVCTPPASLFPVLLCASPCLSIPLASRTLTVHRRHPHPPPPTARSIPAKRPRADGPFFVSGCLPAPRKVPL